MRVAEAHHHRRARGRRLVIALQRLAGLDDGQGAGRVDAQRLQHLGGQYLAHAALQRQSPVAEPAIGRLARPFGAQVQQPVPSVAQLREQQTAAIADVGIIVAELMAMIAQRQRLRQAALQRREPPEMSDPCRIAQRLQPDLRRCPVIAVAQDRLREVRRRDRIGDVGHQRVDFGGGAIICRLRRLAHAAIWGSQGGRIKLDRL